MAINDYYYDTTPANQLQQYRGPSVTALRTALTTLNAGYYTSTVLNGMTERDMRWALKQSAVVVTGD